MPKAGALRTSMAGVNRGCTHLNEAQQARKREIG
jgi:hypothetical protein